MLVARPRHWKGWRIQPDGKSVWAYGLDAAHNRVVHALFSGREDAVRAMHALAAQVRRLEDAEIEARRFAAASAGGKATDGGGGGSAAVMADMLAAVEKRAVEREESMVARMAQTVEAAVARLATPSPVLEDAAAPAQEERVPTPPPPAKGEPSDDPMLAVPDHARAKRPRVAQHVVRPISHWGTVQEMLAYARSDLVPQEKRGAAWRLRDAHGQPTKGPTTMWRKYQAVAVAVGLCVMAGAEETSVADAERRLQERRQGFRSDKQFFLALDAESAAAAGFKGRVPEALRISIGLGE
jgi:hypothetical protein